jgi:hypothetical protein
LKRRYATRPALRALFHRTIKRIGLFTSGLLGEVPENSNAIEDPDRTGMPCYWISFYGGDRMWVLVAWRATGNTRIGDSKKAKSVPIWVLHSKASSF